MRLNNFSRRDIGHSKGRSIDASLTRAFRRLERRGLLSSDWKGYTLTETGREVAQQLSVNVPQDWTRLTDNLKWWRDRILDRPLNNEVG
jgi:DNA-binding PadR family transcriptional regulator